MIDLLLVDADEVTFGPGETTLSSVPMNCPKCKTKPIHSTIVSEVEVDQCPTCRGIWFDEKELSRLLSADAGDLKPLTRTARSDDENEVTGACPRDGHRLLRVRSAKDREVTVDMCPSCRGIWLDGGEFRRLVEAD